MRLRSVMTSAAAVLMFAILMAGLTATARADDAPPAVYVPPPVDARVTKAEGRLDHIEQAQQQQAEINARVLAELKALRADLAATKNTPAVVKVDSPSAKHDTPTMLPPASTSERYKPTRPNLTGAPIDHTHTCRNGHTWDHTMDGGSHDCPYCGAHQTYQDAGRKPVTMAVREATRAESGGTVTATATAATAATTTAQPAPILAYSLGGSGSGCANGACAAGGYSSYSQQRTGWYPGKLLGR